MERSGKPAWVDNDWFEPDSALSDRPEFIAYRNWVATKGTRTYLTFLLAHPWYLLRSIVYNPNVPDERYLRVMPGYSILDHRPSVPSLQGVSDGLGTLSTVAEELPARPIRVALSRCCISSWW